jgi:pyrimidine-specific ribonucleoside hydrolase
VNNSYWLLPDLQFIRRLHPSLQRYLAYVYERSARPDFLVALEEDPPSEVIDRICQRSQHVWETALWAQVAHRRLMRRGDGQHRLVPEADLGPGDTIFPERLVPCRVDVRPEGLFTFEKTTEPTNFSIYEREDPKQNEAALREALPALYESFRLDRPRVQ